jgi:hypothetical protein
MRTWTIFVACCASLALGLGAGCVEPEDADLIPEPIEPLDYDDLFPDEGPECDWVYVSLDETFEQEGIWLCMCEHDSGGRGTEDPENCPAALPE